MSSRARASVMFAVCLLLLAGPASAWDEGPELPGWETLVAAQPERLASADLNGDNVPDLIVLHRTLDQLSVLLGVGDGTFAAPLVTAVGDDPRSVAVADFDEDGVPDVVVSNFTPGTVTLALGAGDGTFGPLSTIVVGGGPREVATADLDADGSLDVAVVREISDRVTVLLGAGDGTFGAPGTFVTGDAPSAITVAHLDNDDVLDLAVVDQGPFAGPANISVLLGVGDGSFGPRTSYGTGTNLPGDIVAADFDADGNLDLAASSNQARATILFGAGDGTFGAPVDVAQGAGGEAVVGVDVSGDGVSDLVIMSLFEEVSVAINNGNGTFKPIVQVPAGDSARSGVVVDLDGNGLLDLAVADAAHDTLIVFPGNGDGSFGARRTAVASPALPAFVVTADLDGDGVLDVVTGHAALPGPPPTAGKVSSFLGNGDGTFGPGQDFAVADFTSSGPSDVVVADLDDDGEPDLVVAVRNEDAVAILLGNGAGAFSAFMHHAVIEDPCAVEVGDVDGDGFLDVVAVSCASSPVDPAADVAVLIGVGDGTFGPAQVFAAGGVGRDIAVGDLNGDQRDDVLVASEASADVTVLLGTGGRTPLTFVQSVPVGTGPVSLALGDVNGNGVLDMLAVDRVLDRIQVRLGVGDGTLGTPAVFSAGLDPDEVRLADVDDDGDLDALVSEAIFEELRLLRGNGNGTFGWPELFAVGPVSDFFISDMDGDGRVDLTLAARELVVAFHRDGPWCRFGFGLAGTNGTPLLEGFGPLVAGEDISIRLSGARANALPIMTVGFAPLFAPFKGGTLVPDVTPPGFLQFLGTTGPSGGFTISTDWPAGIPSGFATWLQCWIQDPAAPVGWTASHAVSATAP